MSGTTDVAERDPVTADRHLADRVAIVDLLGRYCRLTDVNRPDEQAESFTADGRVSYGGPGRWIEGRVAIAASLRSALAAYSATSHLLGPSEISFGPGPDAATVSTWSVLLFLKCSTSRAMTSKASARTAGLKSMPAT